MTAKKMRKKSCKCKIRGIVEMAEIKQGHIGQYLIHPDYYAKWLRKFKFCPLCGKELTQSK